MSWLTRVTVLTLIVVAVLRIRRREQVWHTL